MASRALLVLLLVASLAAPAAAQASAAPDAIIRWTEHGIPHITADDDAGLGYGYGYAVARDNLCLLAESYMTVAGERSRWLGPDGSFVFHANGATHPNLDSDLYYRQVLASGVIERQLHAPPPLGVRPEVQALVRGYVAGYNRYLADIGGAAGVRDPTCRGKPWVRPIDERLAYARFMQLASLAGGGLAITGIGEAQPPPPGAPGSAAAGGAVTPAALSELGNRLGLGGMGSNALALGRAATSSGAGMLLGNPHLPWEGDYRLYQAHLTIPGRLDVEGATFIGVPLVVIGHTRGLAWSHTTSSAFRFTPFELTLAPGSPTTYLVDGRPKQMTSRTIAVPVRRPDGSTGEVRRTLYSTEYGPMLTELLGLKLFPWTPAKAFAFGDANAENLRYLNHFYETDRAENVAGLEAILRRDQGIPWANTVAADASGATLYADASVVPHVTDRQAAECDTALGAATFAQLRLPVLDGSRSACAWGSDPDAVVPGIFGPSHLPFLHRADYVENSNDSYWLTNPAQPLEGFARIIGDERTERSLRTRLALRMVRDRLAGTDGRTGRSFTLPQLQEMMFEDRNGAGELMRDALVELCRSLPVLPSSSGPVAKGDTCGVLARWDLHEHLGSAGSILFRRFTELAIARPIPGSNAVGGGSPMEGTWRDAFDPARPVDTPHELDTANPQIQRALGDAVAGLRAAGIPLDAAPRDVAFAPQEGTRIPLHGGPGADGIFDATDIRWKPGGGYGPVVHGGTFVMAVELRGACPPARTLVTYSQSGDPTSPFYADQTRLLSASRWVTERYCMRDVLASPGLRARRLGCLPATDGTGERAIAWLAPGTSARRARHIAGTPGAHGRLAWRWCVAGGGGVHAALVGGRHRRVALVATTARSARIAGARAGRRLASRSWHRLAGGLRVRRLGRTRTAVARLSDGRVRWVGLARPADARSARSLRRLERRARLPVR